MKNSVELMSWKNPFTSLFSDEFTAIIKDKWDQENESLSRRISDKQQLSVSVFQAVDGGRNFTSKIDETA